MTLRRGLLAWAAVSSVGLGKAMAQPGGAPAMMGMPGMPAGPMTVQSCIESCWRSHVMCLETARYCLEKGGLHATPAHQSLLADCAEICLATANALIRRSSQHAVFCKACAEVCDACARQCERFTDDQRMAVCARTCRECAGHCREMADMPL